MIRTSRLSAVKHGAHRAASTTRPRSGERATTVGTTAAPRRHHPAQDRTLLPIAGKAARQDRRPRHIAKSSAGPQEGGGGGTRTPARVLGASSSPPAAARKDKKRRAVPDAHRKGPGPGTQQQQQQLGTRTRTGGGTRQRGAPRRPYPRPSRCPGPLCGAPDVLPARTRGGDAVKNLRALVPPAADNGCPPAPGACGPHRRARGARLDGADNGGEDGHGGVDTVHVVHVRRAPRLAPERKCFRDAGDRHDRVVGRDPGDAAGVGR